jgi:hypothetical protein
LGGSFNTTLTKNLGNWVWEKKGQINTNILKDWKLGLGGVGLEGDIN